MVPLSTAVGGATAGEVPAVAGVVVGVVTGVIPGIVVVPVLVVVTGVGTGVEPVVTGAGTAGVLGTCQCRDSCSSCRGCPSWRNARNKSCKNAWRSSGSVLVTAPEEVVPVPPVVGVGVVTGVEVVPEVPGVAAAWLVTNCVNAASSAVNSVLPRVPPPPESASPSWSALLVKLRVVPSKDARFAAGLVPDTAFVVIILSLFEISRMRGIGDPRKTFSGICGVAHANPIRRFAVGFGMRRHPLLVLLAALGMSCGAANAADPTAVAQDSHVSILTADQVIQILDETVDWYRTLGTQQQNATQPSDLLILFANRQTADKVVALAFEIARANAELLSSEAAAGQTADASPQALNRQRADLEAKRKSIEDEMAADGRRAVPGKSNPTLDATLLELQGELAMVAARKNLLDTMADFVNESDPKGAG